MSDSIRAVLWDFGGVFTTSPFLAFNRYEAEQGLPKDFIRQLNARNPETNAWALLERSDVSVDDFCPLFEAEARELGQSLSGRAVLDLLAGQMQPQMVTALKRVRERYKTACLTNNVRSGKGPGMARSPELAAQVAEVMALFDAVVESSKVGVRKPETRFYEIACETLEVAPNEAVFLDDLGINLKPARALGMTTIKVGDADAAIAELGQVLGMELA